MIKILMQSLKSQGLLKNKTPSSFLPLLSEITTAGSSSVGVSRLLFICPEPQITWRVLGESEESGTGWDVGAKAGAVISSPPVMARARFAHCLAGPQVVLFAPGARGLNRSFLEIQMS